jgi:phosphoenolpyruvate carboxylase
VLLSLLQTISLVEMVLHKADPRISARYASRLRRRAPVAELRASISSWYFLRYNDVLVPLHLQQLGAQLQTELAQTITAVLEVLGQSESALIPCRRCD